MAKKVHFTADQLVLSDAERQAFSSFLNTRGDISLELKAEILLLLKGKQLEQAASVKEVFENIPDLIEQEESLSPGQKETLLTCVSKLKFQLGIALNESQLPSQQHLTKVLVSANKDDTQKKRLETIIDEYYHWKNGKNTMAIAKLQNITRLFNSNDIYDILKNKIEYVSYHEKYGGQEFETCAITGVRVKNYRVVRDKTSAATFIVGENIDTLYQDFGVTLPVNVQAIKEEFLVKLEEEMDKETDIGTDRMFSVTPAEARDMIKEAEELLKRANQKLETGIYEQLQELYKKLEKNPDASLALRALRGKGSYLNRFIQQKNALPTYILDLVEKAQQRRGALSNAEYLVLFEYYARQYLIPKESISSHIENLKYFAKKKEVDLVRIQGLLQKRYLSLFEISQLLEVYPQLFTRTQEENKHTLEQQKNKNGSDIHTTLEKIYPLFLQDKKVWHQSFRDQNFLLAKNLSNADYGFIKKILTRWTFGMGNFAAGYAKDVLEDTMTRIESIEGFAAILQRLQEIEKSGFSVEPRSLEEVIAMLHQSDADDNVLLKKFIEEHLPKIEKSLDTATEVDKNIPLSTNIIRLGEYLPKETPYIAAKIAKIEKILTQPWIVSLPDKEKIQSRITTHTYFRKRDIDEMASTISDAYEKVKRYAPQNGEEFSQKLEFLKKFDGHILMRVPSEKQERFDFSAHKLSMQGLVSKSYEVEYYEKYKVEATYSSLSQVIDLRDPLHALVMDQFCDLVKNPEKANFLVDFGIIVDEGIYTLCDTREREPNSVQCSQVNFSLLLKMMNLLNGGLESVLEKQDRLLVAASRRRKFSKEKPNEFSEFYQKEYGYTIKNIQKNPLIEKCITGISAVLYKAGGSATRIKKYTQDPNYFEKNMQRFLETSGFKDFLSGEKESFEIAEEYKKNLCSDRDNGLLSENEYNVYLQLLNDFEETIQQRYISLVKKEKK